MTAPLVLVLAVALAYLAAHVVFDWLARRFLIISGAEYLVLGILLGPQVSGALSAELLAGFAPLTTLALGWIGALVGMQFYLPALVRIPAPLYKAAFGEALATLAVVAGLEALLAHWLLDMSWRDAFVPGVGLGAIAAVSAPAGIEVVARRLGRRGPIVRQLEVATAIDALVGIVALGLLLCIRHPTTPAFGRVVTETEWAVIAVGVGVVGGTLFHLFLGGERERDRLFIALAGSVILTSGAAAHLRLSPLFAAMLAGVILVNTSRNRDEIARTLARAERPFYFVLLVFGGATWQPSARSWVAPVLLFLLARTLGKLSGARAASRLAGAEAAIGDRWGRALLGQGGLALALGLEYATLGHELLANVVFTAALASVLLTDVASARLIHSVVAPLIGERRPSSPSNALEQGE